MTPEDLQDCATRTDEIRIGFLFDVDTAGIDPIAEQFYLLAMTDLEKAVRHFRIAHTLHMQALTRHRT